jgi:phosphoribosylaminoimidazole (AIR) synthetase
VATDEEELALQDTADPDVRLRLLAYRVSVLTREKENLEVRVAKMEKSFNMGAGILLVMPILGSIIAVVLAYGKTIFKPWTQ